MGAETTEYGKFFVEQLTAVQFELLAFVASMLPFSREDVQDVVQEVNLAILSHAGSYHSSRPFAPWALRIARNKTIDWLRAKKKERALLLFDSEATDFAESFFAESFSNGNPGLLARLNICREKLPPKQSQLIDLHYDKGLTCLQIARRLNRKKENVHAQLVYVRRKLGECMRTLCKLDDVSFERLHPTAADALFAKILDKGDTSRRTRAEFLRTIADKNALILWLDQATVHELLLRQRVTIHRHFWLPISAVAASLASGIACDLCSRVFQTLE